MARKNLIGVSDDTSPATTSASAGQGTRPIAGFVPPSRPAGPIGGISKSLSSITSTIERAQGLERQLAEGQTVIELDPSLIDSSFVSDRLSIGDTGISQLADQIRQNGQQVPILVRPHPVAAGRFQVAYGHRRLSAVRMIGLKVKAVVRNLTDDQLVVSQGQENNSRTDLSYIERALFASRLDERMFSREIIMTALGVDKAALSKMLTTVKQVSINLIEAIGPAPDVGRRRWMEFAERLDDAKTSALLALLLSDSARAKSSEERFQIAVDEVHSNDALKREVGSMRATSQIWAPKDKLVSVKLTKSVRQATIAVQAKDGLEFADYITSQLESLYEAFRTSEKSTVGD